MAYTESADDSTWTKLLGSLLNAFLIVVMLVVVTIIMVCLYKYRCLKVIYGWMVLSVVLMLGVLGGYLL
jgi:presenilin 1